VGPTAAALAPGGTAQFTDTVTGATNQAVTRSATGGTITQSGLYTAGSTPGAYSVTAQSVQDPTATESATVTITDGTSDLPPGSYEFVVLITGKARRSETSQRPLSTSP
jgi:hypothetical protein